jgi:ADP-ribosyl-[dinitrogen reductase] hydrolase
MPAVQQLPNTYWVQPGSFAAGEYPGAAEPQAAAVKLGHLLDAGFDLFLDLTEEGEDLEPYQPLLYAEATRRGRGDVVHQRMPIRDLRVPTRQHMRAILDVIDAALAAGRRVYLHCWGGVGRTGTVVGCHLVRHGLSGDTALLRLHGLFADMAKSALRASPATRAQRALVRSWQEDTTTPANNALAAAPVAAALDAVELGAPVSFRGLTVFPLFTREPRAPAWLTLGEAVAAGSFEITEISEAGSVPQLHASNRGARPVLLIDGEELIGAKQNRVVNLTILVAAMTTLVIPVSCVEQGRWQHASRAFRASDRAMFARARARKMRDVTSSLRQRGDASTQQGEVWRDIQDRLGELNVASPTSAMSDVFEHFAASVDEYVAQLAPADGQVGAVFGVRDAAIGVELFADAHTFARSLPKLVRSYALELVAGPAHGAPARSAAQSLLTALAAAPSSRHAGVGAGATLRIEEGELQGSALVVDERVVHLTAFRIADADRSDPPSRHAGSRSQQELARLFQQGLIRCQPAPILGRTPPPLPAAVLADRIEGMLLGLAIGDALGNTSEGLAPAARRARFGEIRDYLPHPFASGRAVGLPSGDTQLAFRTLRRLLDDGSLDPERLAREFVSHRIFGIGSTTRRFIRAFKDERRPWTHAGQHSAGNGALARIAPVLVPHARRPSPALWADTALAAMITHNDPASTGACIAFIELLWGLIGRSEAPEPEWWAEQFCATMRAVEGDDARYVARVPGPRHDGPIWAFAQQRVARARAADLHVGDACARWRAGGYLLETVPAVLYILARHGDDPQEAIVRAVNDTHDNDSIAAIVGAAVGALHGRRALPERWLSGLLGRSAEADDGEVFRLAARAAQA